MTLYTLENLIQIACFDVSSSELVILSEIKVRMPLKDETNCCKRLYTSCIYNCYCFYIKSDIFSSKIIERKSFRLISLFKAFDKLRSKKYHFGYCFLSYQNIINKLVGDMFCSNAQKHSKFRFVNVTRVCT